MPVAAILSLSITIGIFILSLIFKVTGKLRLSIPIIYIAVAVISTFFTDWVSKNEQLVWNGLYVIMGLIILSWIVSLVKAIKRKRQAYYDEDFVSWQIQKAREMGVPLNGISFDENHNLIDPRTGKAVDFSTGE